MEISKIRYGRAFGDWLNGVAEQLRDPRGHVAHTAVICDDAARQARADERVRIRRRAAVYERHTALPALLTLSLVAAAEMATACDGYDADQVMRMLGRRINQQIKLRRERSTFFDHRYLAELRAALGGEIAQQRRKVG